MSQAKFKNEIISIIKKYINGKATPAEKYFLEQYYMTYENEPDILESFSQDKKNRLKKEMYFNISKRIQTTSIIKMQNWYKVAAAVAAIFITTSLFFIYVQHEKFNRQEIAKVNQQKAIVPGKDKAYLTLSDGSIVELNGSSQQIISKDELHQQILIKDGHVKNISKNNDASKVAYNTLNIPKGGQYKLTLSDGTNVWLNAASSIRYPVSFIGKERRVDITGEAYFEVAHNAAKPFVVYTNNIKAEVLGTHFNINAYGDEKAIKTTLIEGKLNVINLSSKKSGILLPHQQAVVNGNDLNLKENVDVEEVTAWKNGYFIFRNTEFTSIMNQISRWYDVDIKYENNLTNVKIIGKVPRTVNINEMLTILESTGWVKCSIINKTIVVKSQ